MHAHAMHAITVTLPDSLRLWFGSLHSLSLSLSLPLFLSLSLALPLACNRTPLSSVGYAFLCDMRLNVRYAFVCCLVKKVFLFVDQL